MQIKIGDHVTIDYTNADPTQTLVSFKGKKIGAIQLIDIRLDANKTHRRCKIYKMKDLFDLDFVYALANEGFEVSVAEFINYSWKLFTYALDETGEAYDVTEEWLPEAPDFVTEG